MGVCCNQTSNTAVNDINAKKSARCSWVLIVTELFVSGTQCTKVPRQLTVPWTLARNWEKMTPDTGSSVTVASFSAGASFNPAFNSCSVNTTYNGTALFVYIKPHAIFNWIFQLWCRITIVVLFDECILLLLIYIHKFRFRFKSNSCTEQLGSWEFFILHTM